MAPKTDVIEQLRERVRELEEEKKELQALLDFDNTRLDQIEDELEDVEYLGPFVEGVKVLKTKLAASQAYAEQLREALEPFCEFNSSDAQIEVFLYTADIKKARQALALPHSTSALDAYVEQKVKVIIESHAPEGRNVTNAQYVEMRQRFLDKLAASQLYAEQLREALSAALFTMEEIWREGIECLSSSDLCEAKEALALPRDTSALDAYVSEKVKEALK